MMSICTCELCLTGEFQEPTSDGTNRGQLVNWETSAGTCMARNSARDRHREIAGCHPHLFRSGSASRRHAVDLAPSLPCAARLFAWVDAMREKLPASLAFIEQKDHARDLAFIHANWTRQNLPRSPRKVVQ